MHSKITCPGNISALAVSPDGVYCAAACCESVFIWQVNHGQLDFHSFSYHCTKVTNLEFINFRIQELKQTNLIVVLSNNT